jgi:hypothetical protein
LAEAIAVPAGWKTFKAALWTNNRQISPTVGQSFHPVIQNLSVRSPKIENRASESKQKRVMARFLLKFMANLSG